MSKRLKRSSPIPALGFIGLALLVVAANACVFDQGSYKKGGRLDTGASGQQSSSSSGKTSSSSGSPFGDDDDTVQDSGSILLDTGTQ